MKKSEDALARAKKLISQYRNELNICETSDNDEAEEDQSEKPIKPRALLPSHSDAEYNELSAKFAALQKEFSDLKSEYDLSLLDHEETAGQFQKTKTEIE